ncbi:MAG: hypothetical protein HYW49_00140 [Deltaproteobacteria bacterium]|nr:hypothetical protein [Deltaproteobacteria bacterium]
MKTSIEKSGAKILATLALALTLAQALTACGSNSTNANPNNNGLPAPTYGSLPQPPAGGTVPMGYYWGPNGYAYGCPTGYVQSGNSCIVNTNGGNVVCGSNMSWNGWACVPNNFNCPNGGQFSYYYGGCVTMTCEQQNILWGLGTAYVCKYTTGAPQTGCWFNGYAWQCK